LWSCRKRFHHYIYICCWCCPWANGFKLLMEAFLYGFDVIPSCKLPNW
jgi:hypothetical protein